MNSKKLKPKVGVLSLSNLRVFEIKEDCRDEVDFKKTYDLPTLKKAMGYALNTVRTHGIGLNTWDHIQIDISNVTDNTSELDVYFMEDATKSKVNVLGINVEMNENQDLIYATEQGVVKYNTETKKFALIVKQAFVKNYHNYFQIKYLSKK